jgi:hypothetical protein
LLVSERARAGFHGVIGRTRRNLAKFHNFSDFGQTESLRANFLRGGC